MKHSCILLFFLVLLFPCGAWGQTPLTWDPAATQAGTQVYTHPNALAGDYNFTVVVPAGPESGLRFRLDVTAGNADIYVKQGSAATVADNQFRSILAGSDLITLQPAQYTAGQTWHIMVRAVAGASWNLLAGDASVTQAWDPGTADAGSIVYTHPNTNTGDYYFRIATQNAADGGWRSALKITSGEAELAMTQGALPLAATGTFNSARVGSDGWVLRPDQFTAGQDWFIRVRVTSAAAWTLYTGNVFVQTMGTLAWADANSNGFYDPGEAVTPNGSGAVTVGPEAMRFFRQTVPAGVPAWSLWLNGDARNLAVRRAQVPFLSSASYYGRRQAGQLLLVPPFLGSGAEVYFLGIDGTPGETVNLDSRIQFVQPLAFNATVPSVSVTAAPYRVYRTEVPIDQIAWDVSTTAVSGNPNVCVRKANVPAEFDNEAFSEAPGGATDSVTLVPDSLTNATYYITVYGASGYTFALSSGDPVVTTMAYTDVRVNDQPTRSGWRYYRLTDIPAQLGTLGWELLLTNQVPGSMIALRRNKVPSRWQSRSNGSTTISDTNTQYMDFSGSLGFLQRPGHQADIWYVGIFTPQLPLGAFTLDAHPIVPAPVAFNGSSTVMTGILPGRWIFQTVTVPAGVAGWDLRLRNISGPNPQVVVRRDLLPSGLSGSGLSSQETWPSGASWIGTLDWSGRTYDTAAPTNLIAGRGMVMSTGRPLEPGTYYVGTFNSDATNSTTATLVSRGIGTGQTIPVGTLGYAAGSSVAVNNLAPREAAYYTVTVPPNTPSWELTLAPTAGEMMMAIRRGGVPDFDAPGSSNGGTGNIQALTGGTDREMDLQKLGPERFVILPVDDADFLVPGDYTIAVVSEGTSPPDNSTIGAGTSSGVLTSNGPLVVTNLGTVTTTISQSITLVGAQVKAYTFTVPVGSPPLEVRLDSRVGNPNMALISGARVPQPGGQFATYGYLGGETNVPSGEQGRVQDPDLLTFNAPTPGVWHLIVRAESISGWPDASATLVIQPNGPVPLPFDGGTQSIAGQLVTAWRYFSVTVPAGVDGWDLRLKNLTGGTPQMVVRRDLIPSSSSGTVSNSQTTWPTGGTWSTGRDWTGRTLNSNSPTSISAGNGAVLSMGRPLEPGTYIVGVQNSGSTPVSYTVESRGIGAGQTIPVNTMPQAAGSSVTISNLTPREAAYYRVTVPPNTPSWEFTLTPTTGEMMMAARRGGIPDFLAPSSSNGGSGNLQLSSGGDLEVKMQKPGPERYLLLPVEDQDFILPGDYTIAVISEGIAPPPDGNTIGTGTSSGTLTSHGSLAVTNLGAASISGITQPVSLVSTQVKAYTFTVPAGTASLEVRLDNRVGNPVFSLISGARIPSPGTSFGAFGYAGGEFIAPAGGVSRAQQDVIYTLANPPATTYHLTVRAETGTGGFIDASANLVIIANAPVPLAFDGGTASISGVSPQAWRYFTFTVPPGAIGWDLRLKNLTSGTPQITLRRDLIPAISSSSGVGNTLLSWPTGAAYRGQRDWTGRTNETGSPTFIPNGDGFVISMGRPLEPGTYYAGIFNAHTTQTAACTIESRGIGTGYTIPVGTLGFAAGSSVTVTGLAPRQAAYYTVTVPAATPSWEFSLTPSSGEVMMAVRRSGVPDFLAATSGDLQFAAGIGGDRQIKAQKAGAERYVLLPYGGQTTIQPGDYTIAVISEGVNPPDINTIGTATSTATLTSHGPLITSSLGAATAAGLSSPLTLLGGQVRSYSFTVPAGTQILEMSLENRVGNPIFASMGGVRIPQPTNSPSNYGYAQGETIPAGGGLTWLVTPALRTVENPPAGNYSITVRADTGPGGYPDASATLVIRQKSRLPLNFDIAQNGNGASHTDTRTLLDTGKNFYQLTVPATLGGQPVLGWKLNVAESQGSAALRIFKTWGSTAGQLSFSGQSALIVPPFLVPGDTYYIEVTGTGFTSYTLTSANAVTERPAWTMPVPHNIFFGDTGLSPGGTPLPGDQGTDIGDGEWHLYAVDVPFANSALLRTELLAINGNPNLYIRETAMPSTDQSGTFDRSLTGTGSEYANWVPVNGRDESTLRPGRWYLGVKGTGGTNARYRLKLSTGQVTDLALNSGPLAAQTIVGRDWRYYRFTMPLVAPATWNLTFSQQSGDVVMWLRDTIPPGVTSSGAETNDSGPVGVKSWFGDGKNQGPYSNVGHDAAGTYAFNTAPLRPGHTYYVGFRAINDASFTLSSATTGTIGTIPELPFYGGSIAPTIAANASLLYRIPVPSEAVRLKFTATHPSTVQLRMEQGTLPATTGPVHYSSGTAVNLSYNQALSPSATWPWRPGYDYYLRVVNTSATPQNLTLAMDAGFTWAEWRALYFNSTELLNAAISGPAADPDKDGLSNVNEAAFGGHPKTLDAVALQPIARWLTGPDALGIEFRRAIALPINLTLTVRAGSDLTGWTTLASKTGPAPWTGPAVTTEINLVPLQTTVTTRDTQPPTAGRRFLKVDASVP
jgi:large repetitive protein